MASPFETDQSDQPERRTFIGAIIGTIVTGISAVLGITIGRYSIAPAFAASEAEKWIDLATIDDLLEGTLVRRSLQITQTAGWGEFNTQRLVWVTRRGREVKIFSAVCPHLGCTVNARGDRAASGALLGGFVCACHGSSWDESGNRLDGPTPRALDTLEHRIEGDLIKVKYQDFKQGLAEKEVV